jgi:alpha-1,2-rhamnosyltransferase
MGITKQIHISTFYLGSELDFVSRNIPVQEQILNLRKAGSPLFLMVGTIEPRKNHRQVFNAFRKLWAQGAEVRLVIVSARSWKSDDLLQEITEHPEHGRRLFLIRDASDTDVDWLYRNSDALIMASEVEGFGLPIVEARQRGLPVICSDIPVFREIAIPGTDFFLLYDVDDLVRVVKEFLARPRATERLVTGWITWRESARQLLNEVKLMESRARTC